jgi:hypothetical protein
VGTTTSTADGSSPNMPRSRIEFLSPTEKTVIQRRRYGGGGRASSLPRPMDVMEAMARKRF